MAAQEKRQEKGDRAGLNSRSSSGTPMIYVEDHAYRAAADKENETKNIELDDWLLLSTHIRLIRGVLLQMKIFPCFTGID